MRMFDADGAIDRLVAQLTLAWQKTASDLEASLSQSRLAVRIDAAQVHPVNTGAGVSTSVSRNPGRLVGYALEEATGTGPATLRILDARDPADATLILPISLSAGESTRDSWGGGLAFVRGLYVQVDAGSVTGAVFTGGAE